MMPAQEKAPFSLYRKGNDLETLNCIPQVNGHTLKSNFHCHL